MSDAELIPIISQQISAEAITLIVTLAKGDVDKRPICEQRLFSTAAIRIEVTQQDDKYKSLPHISTRQTQMPLDLSDNITKRHEDQLHTYTALFSPPTPRASPTPGEQAKEDSWRRRSYRASSNGEGIGGGVIVPEMQDPLSIPVLFTQDGEQKNHGNTDADADSMGGTGNANLSLAFFDKFVSEARVASEIKRRSVLDEILLHQDDPLFRWSRNAADDQVVVDVVGGDEAEIEEENQTTENTDEPGPSTFRERPASAGERVEKSPTHSPKRSPTLTSLQPTTLAPPLESTDTTDVHPILASSSLPSSSYSSDSPNRSPYATLSGLHSRWVSSLLNHNNAGNTGIPSSLPANTHIPSDFMSTSSTSTTKHLTPRTITRPHTVTNSNPNTSAHVRPSSVGSISSHSSSPFASHMSVPISGAPGFIEERYNWDKGFSDELIKELEDVNHAGEEWRAVKSDSDQSDTTDTRRVLKLKTRGTTEAKENIGNTTTRILGKTQLAQTLIAGSGISRISKKDKDKDKNQDSAMKRTRGASTIPIVSSGSSVSLGGGPLSNKNHEKAWSEASVRGKGDGNNNEARNDGKLFGELIEKKLGSVELKGRKEITTPVLNVVLADLLRTHLPALDRLPKTWNLVYSLDQHGISLNTLYTRCEAHTQAQAQSQARLGSSGSGSRSGVSRIIGSGIGRPGMLVVIKDSGDSLFGVWIGDGIRQSRGKGYYGSGESFMWRYRNVELDVYKWTGKNKYVVLGEPDYISFGGGEGKYGLYLDETLFEGSSARCPTFDNEPLCSPGSNKGGAVAFECVGLEVWGVGP